MTDAQRQVIKDWVAALRSGEFEQGKMALLRDGGKYCCLGVLCELHRRQVGGAEWRPDVSRSIKTYLGMDGALPDQVLAWSGVASHACRLGRTSAIEYNDSGSTFAEIADLIEQEYLQ